MNLKKPSTIIFLCMIFLQATSLLAQDTDSLMIKKIANDVLANGQAYENLRYICKKIGPRLSGSANAQKAVEATARMLKVAGADTVYLQACQVSHWERGTKENGIVYLNNGSKKRLTLCALGNTVGTSSKGINASIVEVKNFKELESLGELNIKGKIVFFNYPMNPTYIETFKAYGESGTYRVNGPSKAAKFGAVAVIIRSLSSNADDYPHTGVTVYNDTFPKIPAVAISTNDANWLEKQIALNKNPTAFIQTNCKMLKDATSYNVIGEIRGMEFPEEIITVGGHLDSWDLAEGAQDDGAGIVQSIEVLRALRATGIQPKRTIRAVLFMNEENGGKGAKKYLELAKEKKEQHVFALESDAGGFTARGFSLDMSQEKFEKVLQWKNLFYPYGIYKFSKGGSGADIGGLKELGAALAGFSPDSQRYFDVHHAQTDVFENVSKRELHLGALNMAALIYLVDTYGL